MTYVTKETFQKEVLESRLPVLLDFYADWCGPCMAQGKILESIEETYKDVFKICKCNVDENEDLADAFGVSTIPTLVFFRDGAKFSQLSTVLQEAGIKRIFGL